MPQIRKYTYSTPPFTSLGPSHCNVACLEIIGRYGFFCIRFVPKWYTHLGRKARDILRLVRSSVCSDSVRDARTWQECRGMIGTMSGCFWELAWGAIIPDRRKKKYRRHRVLASIRDILSWMDEIEAYDYLLCQRGINTFFLQMLPTLGRRLVKVNILVCGFCM